MKKIFILCAILSNLFAFGQDVYDVEIKRTNEDNFSITRSLNGGPGTTREITNSGVDPLEILIPAEVGYSTIYNITYLTTDFQTPAHWYSNDKLVYGSPPSLGTPDWFNLTVTNPGITKIQLKVQGLLSYDLLTEFEDSRVFDGYVALENDLNYDDGHSILQTDISYDLIHFKIVQGVASGNISRLYIDKDGDGYGEFNPATNDYVYVYDAEGFNQTDLQNLEAQGYLLGEVYLENPRTDTNDLVEYMELSKTDPVNYPPYVTNKLDTCPNEQAYNNGCPFIYDWYLDKDGDGFGEGNSRTDYSAYPTDQLPDDPFLEISQMYLSEFVSRYNYGLSLAEYGKVRGKTVLLNKDFCLNEPGSTKGCSYGQHAHFYDDNIVGSTTYDIEGNIQTKELSFFDALGKNLQTQSYDILHKKIFSNKILYDNQGRQNFTSFPASITDTVGIPISFSYARSLLENKQGNEYRQSDVIKDGGPSKAGKAPNTVGAYYSENNNAEPTKDVTDYPFTVNVYSELNPGQTLRTIGGNKINGEWKQGFSYTFPAAQELYYAFGFNEFDKLPSDSYNYYRNKFVKKFYEGSHYSGYRIDILSNVSEVWEQVDQERNTSSNPSNNAYGRVELHVYQPNSQHLEYDKVYTFRTKGANPIEFEGTVFENLGNIFVDQGLNAELLLSTREIDFGGAFWLKATKQVVQDIHGVENIVFTDTDGQTLASARSGGAIKYPVVNLIGEQGFIDVHIPIGCGNSLEFLGNTNPSDYKIWNLRTEEEINDDQIKEHLPAGFYRVEYIGTDKSSRLKYPPLAKLVDKTPEPLLNGSDESVGVRYQVNYYDYTVNYYDKAGRLVKSKQPIAFDNEAALSNGIQNNYLNRVVDGVAVDGESTFTYNALGQLIESKSPDEGEARFLYRKDGQIRFSQNEKQRLSRKFSYTNYDPLGRPIESGEALLGTQQKFTKESGDTEGTFDYLTSNEDTTLSFVFSNNPSDTRRATIILEEKLETVYDLSENVSLVMQNKPTSVSLHPSYGKQTFVRGNVSCTKNKNIETYYSYDIYGRVKWIVRYLKDLDKTLDLGKTFTIDYEYDPVTSEVVTVDYQKHEPTERFVHRYMYNVGGQLTDVLTTNNPLDDSKWEHQVSYQYYENGSLKRKELSKDIDFANGGYNQATKTVAYEQHNGKDKVLQGIDYVYNLAGQLKQINSFKANADPGGDTNDAFGMYIGYYPGDYLRNESTGVSWEAKKDLGIPQYNGNISRVIWKNAKNADTSAKKYGRYFYRYDAQTNWLKEASFKKELHAGNTNLEVNLNLDGSTDTSTTLNKVANKSITILPGFTFKAEAGKTMTASLEARAKHIDPEGAFNLSDLNYDANGNIQSLQRNGFNHGNSKTAEMDHLAYEYNPSKPNQLIKVTDGIGNGSPVYEKLDFGGETTYEYNDIGQLITETSTDQGITEYTYNAAGLVTKVSNVTLKEEINIAYDDLGQRLYKEHIKSNTTVGKTLYVRDASGSVMSIYSVDGNGNTTQEELSIYGSGRVGIAKTNTITTENNTSKYSYTYELTDHLGNVRNTVHKDNGNVVSKGFADYFPFGMPLPDRNSIKNQYRYAYQGQEKDEETGKEAFELRLWDSRIGRWLTTDPAGQHYSPYLGMGNNPIRRIDPDGGIDGDPSDGAIVYDQDIPGLPRYRELAGTVVSDKDVANLPFRYKGFSLKFETPLTRGNFRLESIESEIASTFEGDQRRYSMSNDCGTVDCSRFTKEVAEIAGYTIPRVAYDQAQWYQNNGTWSNRLSDAQAGDHIFWQRGVKAYHTGMVLEVSTSADGIRNIIVIQAQVYNHEPGSIQIKTLKQNGEIPYFYQPFVGVGRR
ncbi:RHS repeat-associated core domain-containing protein [Wenyingzhuangia sp. IMCC45533]